MILSDTIGTPTTRYADQDLIDAFNDALIQARAKRPDLFLDMGLRNIVPQYTTTDISGNTAFPLDATLYPAFLYYIVGRCELREDTFSDDSRATVMMNKFVSQLMQVSS